MAGDESAFDKLYSLLRDSQLYLAYNIIGNKEAAEDVTQEAFLAAYKNIRQLDNPAMFKAWLNKITYNESMNYLKSNHNYVDIDELSDVIADDADDVTHIIIERERADSVISAIRTMKPEIKAVVTMKYYSKLKETEIAQSLDIPVGTVKSRLHYAKKSLKQKLGSKYPVASVMLLTPYMMKDAISLCGNVATSMSWTVAFGLKAVASVAVVTATTSIATFSMTNSISIASINMYDADIPVNKQVIEVAIDGDASRVNLDDGTMLTKGDDGIWTASIYNNGTYVITASDDKGGSDSADIIIDNIDNKYPDCNMILQEEASETISIKISDDGSGINYDKLRIGKSKGSDDIEYTLDRKQGIATIRGEDLPAYAYVEDNAGNYTEYEVYVKE